MINQFRGLLCTLCVFFVATCLGDNFDNTNINWQNNDPNNTSIIDHQIWNDFLSRYIHPSNGINFLDYGSAKKHGNNQLNKYINQLSATTIARYNRQEQLAFWINFYNALTVRLIVNAYPIESIKSIKLMEFSWPEFSPWDTQLVTINGVNLTLNDIEHKILRTYWHDPRIHYAINCASISCPNLANQAYTTEHLGAMLNEAAIAYINHPRAIDFIDSETIILSSIYDWYRKDFGEHDQAVLNHLIKYAKQPLANKLNFFSGKIKYHYNWNLNDFR